MNALELFVGAGGLALGVSSAGFKHLAVVERDKYCCDTIRENQKNATKSVSDWPLIQSDVTQLTFSAYDGKVDLVTGGPPCQPFSIGGKHRAYRDSRDMFPEAVRCVRECRPKAFLLENVRGLVRPSFFNYFNYICLQLEYPTVTMKLQESWPDHHRRLQKIKTSNANLDLSYNVVRKVLNAADFGVPQRRERVFIVGFRSDLEIEWSFPEATHAEEALLYEQFISREYWEQHKISKRNWRQATPQVRKRLRKIDPTIRMVPWGRWRTVRDAIAGLPDPLARGNSDPSHRFQQGARSYAGHTGSPIDEPGKTLKAGDHGVPGGENTLRLNDESVRYFTVREAARLQTFPDDFLFHGSWTETMRQLGNAVPVELARSVATEIAAALQGA